MDKYKIVNGTCYNAKTDDKVIEVLERIRANRTRVILDYGDTSTGESWGEVYDITGRVGRSGGTLKVPILLHNKRSWGGIAILDSVIIGIKESRGGKILYKWNEYKTVK